MATMVDTKRARRVYIGDSKGQTPKKEYAFTRDQVSTDIPQATPTRGRGNAAPKSILSSSHYGGEPEHGNPYSSPSSANDFNRPKTSRGKSRPSPDEFASYVVPSPPHKFDATNGFSTEDVDNTMFIHTSDSSSGSTANAGSTRRQRVVDKDREMLTAELFHFFQFVMDGR